MPETGYVEKRNDGVCGHHPLPCPRCGELEAEIHLNIACPREGFRCGCCEEEFDIGDVQAIIRRWRPILEWIDKLPHPVE